MQYTAYGALIDKTSVCQGYAVLLYRMLLEAGIDCRVISGYGNGGGHAWNIVRLNGKYYNVDATWDASWPGSPFFMKSDKDFSDHMRDMEYASETFYAQYPMSDTSYDESNPEEPEIPDEPGTPEDSNKLPFTDVPESKWFYNSVKWAYENGLLTGASDTIFNPNGPMTRGMLVTVLYRKEGRPDVVVTNKFPDVNPKKYYAPAIIWASENNLVSGYSNGNFGPEDSITREQIAKILYLYADYKGFDTSNFADISSYKDAANVSGYAKKYMQWAVAEGLIKGSNGELNPKGNATRAEISAILKRFVERYEGI